MIAGVGTAEASLAHALLREDPGAASAIFLTTVTDVVGFFSFLGIATLLMAML